MILLDTQALIWLVEGDGRLGPQARALEADSDQVAVSTISLWEIGLLVSRGRLTLSLPYMEWLDRYVLNDMAIEPVTQAIAIDAGLMGSGIHGDPGDRIIIATARALQCPLVTSDTKILAYAAVGHLHAVDATR